MSSALGKQLGLTEESTLEEIITAVGNVIDYSNTIQYATTDTSDQTKSCYRVNGSYVDIIPARGLWNNWDWGVSCIKVLKSSVSSVVKLSLNASWVSENQIRVYVGSSIQNYSAYSISNFLVQLSLLTRPDDRTTISISYSYSGGWIYITANTGRIFYTNRVYPVTVWFYA